MSIQPLPSMWKSWIDFTMATHLAWSATIPGSTLPPV